MRRISLLVVLAAACGGDEGPFTIVTIETRPAVHDIAKLAVKLTNEGTSLDSTFEVTNEGFPATFSISAPGRTGELQISVQAFDRDDIPVGQGTTDSTVESPTASVLLDSADFVVNTDFAGDQFPSNDFESNGFQIAAGGDGTWTVVYGDQCFAPCNVFGRRFDETGKAVDTQLAAGTNAFPISSTLMDFGATPAVAASGGTTVALWDFNEPAPSTVTGIACRAIDAAGAAAGPQVDVSLEQLPDVVSATATTSGFVVSWNGFDMPTSSRIIRSALVNAQCQPSNVVTVSTVANAVRGSVAANGDRILYAWTVNGDVRGRLAGAAPFTLVGAVDLPLVAKTATERVEYVRVSPLGLGFAVVVRWALETGANGPGRLELYRVNDAGQLIGGPTLISTRSGTDFASSKSFGVTTRKDDGALLVVWHSCNENGDPDQSCGVFGRVLRPNGVPVGEEFTLATTTSMDQTNPAAVGLPGAFAATWMDTSKQPPDQADAAVRARILYPPYNDAKRVIGAACTGAEDCDAGLGCGASSDGGLRCFASCTLGGPQPVCPGGGTCTAVATGGAACTF